MSGTNSKDLEWLWENWSRSQGDRNTVESTEEAATERAEEEEEGVECDRSPTKLTFQKKFFY